ncbi:methionyl-tRNA formyltransferase [Anaerolinea thermophila UNI-1]|uniref:Methionyl-tRNA formyltransferase n=2 Tax=Anaerolinea thermophila TaxID=167964 RepID=E8MXM7_ANATU|nr:methionyl-tRNA formyltransferase [Anaerolinea thermophila UNI-1]
MLPKVVFMGSPEFALPTLKALAEHYPVVGVVTQPDRPAGRGNMLTPPPVKVLAQQLGIEVFQPEKLRNPEAMEKLRTWSPDLIVVAAFGQILRQAVLDLPQFGCINVHASLLPRWRGASPIQAAILHGDIVTGVTIMKMDAGIDTGPILAQREVAIQPDDTAGSLSDRLAEEGANLLIEVLPEYLTGRLHPKPQPEEGATYAKMLTKEEGHLNFEESVHQLVNRVRAYHPWPSAYTFWNGQMLKIHRAQAVQDSQATLGKRKVIEGYPAIGASDGWLVLLEVQPAGKRAMDGKDFLRGARSWSEE